MLKIFELKSFIYQALEELKFQEFSDIQKQVIPLALTGQSIVGKSQTGTGKTHAFLVPLVESLDFDNPDLQAVIITPTRELANQIYLVLNQLIKYSEKPLKVKLYSGGTDRHKEVADLEKSNPQVVIATPGKLYDLVIKEKCLFVHKTKTLIIDEADMALDEGFIEEINEIASAMPKKLQIMTFSATMTKELEQFLSKYMENPEFVSGVSKELSNLNIEHILIKTRYKEKYHLLTKLLEVQMPYLCLIFVNTVDNCKKLYEMMKADGYSVATLHGDLNLRVRKQVLRKVANLDYTYLVCTDIAARGIDILDVSHVINYELPQDVEFYVHRSGRTARFDKVGMSISFYEYENYDYLDKLESLGLKFNFKDIQDDVLVDSKGRNERKQRVNVKESENVKKAKKAIRSTKKVKPAYKKKYKYKLNEEIKKIVRKQRKKR